MLLQVTTSRLIKQTSDYGLNSLLQGIFEPFTEGAPSKNTLLRIFLNGGLVIKELVVMEGSFNFCPS